MQVPSIKQSDIIKSFLYAYIFYLLYNIFYNGGSNKRTLEKTFSPPSVVEQQQPEHLSDYQELPTSFLDDIHHSKLSFIPKEIPKIIHQTWKVKDKLPKKFGQWSQNCRDMHPEEEGLLIDL